MKNKLFDDFIQKQFDGYKPEVGAHIWDNIARKKDRKKPLAFWFFNAAKLTAIAVVMLSCIGIGYYLIHDTNASSTKKITLNKDKNTSPIINDATENSATTINKETITSPTSNQAQQSGGVESNRTTLNKETINLPTTIEQVQEKDRTSSKLINRNNTFSVNSTKNKYHNPLSTILESNNENKFTNVVRKSKHLNGNTSINISKGETDDTTNNLLTANIATVNIINETSIFIPTIKLKKLPAIAFVPCPEAEENAAGNKKYIELFGGADYIFKTYTDTGDAYIAQRKASTGIHYAFSAGLRYTKVFGSGISFRTGINYSQINERFIAFNGFVLEHIVQVNNVGDTIANYTAASVQYKKSTNIYRTIDIPLQAGFEFGNGRLHTNISAGALVNIVSKQTGNAVEPNGNVIDLSSSKTSSQYQYKSNIGVSFLGSVSVYYKVNEKLHLMAEPYLRYSLSPLTKPEITFKQKFHTAGLRLGLRWDL